MAPLPYDQEKGRPSAQCPSSFPPTAAAAENLPEALARQREAHRLRRMACLRRMLLALAACLLVSLGLASARAPSFQINNWHLRPPCHRGGSASAAVPGALDDDAAQEAPALAVDMTAEEASARSRFEDLLQRYMPDQFPEGGRARHAEVVDRVDEALARLRRRQATDNTTTTTEAATSTTASSTSSTPSTSSTSSTTSKTSTTTTSTTSSSEKTTSTTPSSTTPSSTPSKTTTTTKATTSSRTSTSSAASSKAPSSSAPPPSSLPTPGTSSTPSTAPASSSASSSSSSKAGATTATATVTVTPAPSASSTDDHSTTTTPAPKTTTHSSILTTEVYTVSSDGSLVVVTATTFVPAPDGTDASEPGASKTPSLQHNLAPQSPVAGAGAGLVVTVAAIIGALLMA